MIARSVAFVLLAGWSVSGVPAAEPQQFSRPLDVNVERAKIVQKFAAAVAPTQGTNDPAYQAALAERNEALGQLVAAAEAEPVPDQAALAQVYLILQRYDDAARAGKAALESNAEDWPSRFLLISALCQAGRGEEAAVAFGQLTALEVSNPASYLRDGPAALRLLVKALLDADKTAQAEQALAAWDRQLEKVQVAVGGQPELRTDLIAAKGMLPQLGLEVSRKQAGAQQPAQRMKVDNQTKRARAAQDASVPDAAAKRATAGTASSGRPTQVPPASAEAVKAAEAMRAARAARRPSAKVNPADRSRPKTAVQSPMPEGLTKAGSAPPAAKSELGAKLSAIYSQYNLYPKFSLPASQTGPEWEKFSAERTAALSKLAEEAETAKSTDHAVLVELYTALRRYDDVARELQALIKQDPTDLSTYQRLLQTLCRAKRPDEALLAMSQWLAVEVPPAKVTEYLAPLEGTPSTIELLMKLLAESGDTDRAVNALETMQGKLDQLFEQFGKASPPTDPSRVAIVNARIVVLGLRDGVEKAMAESSKSDLRKKLDKILAEFSAGRRRSESQDDGPGDEKRMADRAAALAALAADPETTGSDDLPTLLELYVLSNRPDDALHAFCRWLALDVPRAKAKSYLAPLEPLASPFGPANKLVTLLLGAGRFRDAKQAAADAELKLDHLLEQYDKGPAPPAVPRTVITGAMVSVMSMWASVEKEAAKTFAKATNPIPLDFAAPLRVGVERRVINNIFATMRAGHPRPQVIEKAKAWRHYAMEQLAAAAEAAHSKEHVALAVVYIELERYDDAEREARTSLKQDPADTAARAALIELMARSQRTGEALAAFRELIALPVPAARAVNFLDIVSNTALSLASQLADEGRFAEAMSLFQEYSALDFSASSGSRVGVGSVAQSLANLLMGAGEPALAEKVLDRWQAFIDNQSRLQVADELPPWWSESIAAQRAALKKRSELVGKAYFPIASTVWLGTPPSPEELRGKVVLVYHWEQTSWCGADLAELSALEREFGSKGLKIVGVVLGPRDWAWDATTNGFRRSEALTRKQVDAETAALLQHFEVTSPMGVDADHDINEKFAVENEPHVGMLLDKQGLVQKVIVGRGTDDKALRAAIRKALEPPANSTGK